MRRKKLKLILFLFLLTAMVALSCGSLLMVVVATGTHTYVSKITDNIKVTYNGFFGTEDYNVPDSNWFSLNFDYDTSTSFSIDNTIYRGTVKVKVSTANQYSENPETGRWVGAGLTVNDSVKPKIIIRRDSALEYNQELTTAYDTNYEMRRIVPNEYSFKLSSSGTYTVTIAYNSVVGFCGSGTKSQVVSGKNYSRTYSFKIDNIEPTISITTNGSSLASGAVVGNDTTITASDLNSPGIYLKKPGENTFKNVGTSYVVTTSMTNGQYSFYGMDTVGNKSAENNIVLDSIAPVGILFSDGKIIASNSLTRGNVRYSATDLRLKQSYVKLPGSSNFIAYGGQTYTQEGKFQFFSVDTVSNESEVYTIIIDRTPKAAFISNVTDGKTGGDVVITWDVLVDKAQISTVTVNGNPYAKGSTLVTVQDGAYKVKTVDTLGNVWEYSFVSFKPTRINSVTYNREWWETTAVNTQAYSFESYDNAFVAAFEREASFVRTAVWAENSPEWDGGLAMDSVDAINAKRGIYYIYKSEGNKNVEVAFFTHARLDEIKALYASQSIKSYYYYQREPSQAYDDNNLNLANSQGIYYTKKLELRLQSGLSFWINGEEVSSMIYDVAGKHILETRDNWGNIKQNEVYIITAVPAIAYAVGEGAFNYVDFVLAGYYLKNSVKLKPECLDPYGMLLVTDEKGEQRRYVKGEQALLNDSGKYIIQSVNHHGYSSSVEIYISLTSAKITSQINTSKKKLDIAIVKSPDKFAAVTALYIDKSVDAGKTWRRLTKDDYGSNIEHTRFSYSFKTSGMYRITVEDKFRNGINAEIYQTGYVQSPPSGILNGVENGGFTNKGVIFNWTDEATAAVSFNALNPDYSYVNRDYTSQKLEAEGKYTVVLSNMNGDFTSYTFVIDSTKPQGQISGVNELGYSNNTVFVAWLDASDIEAPISAWISNGIDKKEYVKGEVLEGEGAWTITLIDSAGNEQRFMFTIDRTPPKGELKAGGKLLPDSGGLTNKTVYFSWSEKATATLNGEVYLKNTAISQEKVYTIILTDYAGNNATFDFELNKSIPIAAWSTIDGKELGNSAVTRNAVVLTLEEKYTYNVFVEINDILQPYAQIDTKELEIYFSFSGNFTVELENDKGIKFSYKINVILPVQVDIEAQIVNENFTNKDIVFTWSDKLITATLNGKKVSLDEQKLVLASEGKYDVVFTNAAGQTKLFYYTILKTVPTAQLISGGESIASGAKIKGSFSVEYSEQAHYLQVMFNGKKVSGKSFELAGEYTIIVYDAAGNYSKYIITIATVYKMNAFTIILICLCVALAIGTVGIILYIRKKPFNLKKRS